MSSAFDVHIVSIPLGDPAASDTLLLLKAPTDAHGGGIKLLDAWAVNHAATSSTVGFSVALHKYSTAGTPAVNGTISDTLGGTTSHWADSIPQQFTLTEAYTKIDAEEWVAVAYTETNAGNPTNMVITLQYIMGK